MTSATTRPRNPSRSLVGTAVCLALSALLWGALLPTLVVVVPRQKRVFDSFGMRVPALTQAVFDLAALVRDHLWLLAPASAVAALVAVLVTLFVRHRGTSRALAWLWLGLLVGTPLTLNVLIWVGVLIPQQQLVEGLSR